MKKLIDTIAMILAFATLATPISFELIDRANKNGKIKNMTTIIYDINNDGKADLVKSRTVGSSRLPTSYLKKPTQEEKDWYRIQN